MFRLMVLVFALAFTLPVWSTECTMKPAPIDVKRIARHASVKGYVVGANGLVLTALLKNGQAIRLEHTGCDHSGAMASVWTSGGRDIMETDAWLKEAAALARIAFAPEVAGDIAGSLQSGKFSRNVTEARVILSAAPSSFMNYSVVISRIEHGLMLSISYELG